jgi:carbonic anhydrase
MATASVRCRALGLLAGIVLAAGGAAQQHGDGNGKPVAAPAPPQQPPAPATHAPLPELPPLAALAHCQTGNAAHVRARASGKPAPAPADRPAGAGKYVCAVLVCADAGVDVPALLGLAPADLLMLAAPGPFASPETVALLERTVADHRLSLVVVLGHADCASLARRPGGDALQRRRDAAHAEAQRRGEALPPTVARMQRDLLLASSDALQAKSTAGALRVLPATVEPATGAITWLHARAETLPIAPVK